MEANKNEIALDWLLRELSKKGFFCVTESSFPEFKDIIREAQKLERESIKQIKKSIKEDMFFIPICSN
jgi:hypothetical protein